MTEKDALIFVNSEIDKHKKNPLAKFTREQVVELIQKFKGLTFDICNCVGCTPRQFYHMLDKYKLRELMNDARKELVGQAESVIQQALESETEKTRVDAAKWLLERLGKNDGWSQSPTIAQQINIASEKDIKEIFGI